MEKILQKLDEIFKKYNVAEEDIAEVGILFSELGGGELEVETDVEADDFIKPAMTDGYENEEEDLD